MITTAQNTTSMLGRHDHHCKFGRVGDDTITNACVHVLPANFDLDEIRRNRPQSLATVLNTNSRKAQQTTLDEVWWSIAHEHPPPEILDIIGDMACNRHEWLTASVFSDGTHFSARDASRVIITNSIRDKACKGFALGAFSFSPGYLYEIKIATHIKRQDPDVQASVGLLELPQISPESPTAAFDSKIHLNCIPKPKEVLTTLRTMQIDEQTSHVKIIADFTGDKLENNAHFEAASNEKTIHRTSFRVIPPCLLYGKGASFGIVVMRISSVRISKYSDKY